MDPPPLAIDVSSPRAMVATFEEGRPLLLARGDEAPPPEAVAADPRLAAADDAFDAREAPPPLDLFGWDWDQADADVLEREMAAVLREVRARFAPDGPPPPTTLCVPRCAGGRGREAIHRAAASEGLDVRAVLAPCEALAWVARAAGVRGCVLAVSADLGHLEVGVVDLRDDAVAVVSVRGQAVAWGDVFVEDVVAWLSLTIDRSHLLRAFESPGAHRLLAECTRAALVSARGVGDLVVETPFLARMGGAASVTVSEDVLELAFDDLIERVGGACDEALRAAGLAPGDLMRVVVGGRASRLEPLGRRLGGRWELPCSVVGATATALGAALFADAHRLDAPAPGSTIPSAIPPSAPPSVRPSARPSSAPPPSSVPPPRPSAPPPRLATGPVAAATGSRLPRHGPLAFTASPAELLALPIVRAATPDELARPLPLPALLAQVGLRPQLHGTLALHGAGESLRVGLGDGAAAIHPRERPAVVRAFLWAAGTYEVREEPMVGLAGAPREAMAGLVTAGLRVLLREADNDAVAAALGERMHLCPVPIPEREGRLKRMRLTPAEERAILHGFDPATDLATHVAGSSSMLRLGFLLALFEVVSWSPRRADVGGDRRAELALRVARMSAQNHFEVLFVHWTAGGEEVAEAWRRFEAEYGTAGPWHAVDRGLAAQAMTRGAAAWAALSKETGRLRHRAEAYPNVDQEMLIPLIESRAKWLAFAGQRAEAEDMLRLLREIQARPGAPKG
ncbi:MAG: hypothetical protein U0324_22615 [Polyangiales bacterium]